MTMEIAEGIIVRPADLSKQKPFERFWQKRILGMLVLGTDRPWQNQSPCRFCSKHVDCPLGMTAGAEERLGLCPEFSLLGECLVVEKLAERVAVVREEREVRLAA